MHSDGQGQAAAPARKLWDRSLAAKAMAKAAGSSRADTFTPSSDSRMVAADNMAVHSLAVMMEPLSW